jgi:WhiB family redox-sensing transcriptional regulator
MSARDDLANELARRHALPARRLPCQTGDPERFFEGTADDLLAAAGECRPCPVIDLCGAAADESDEKWGVYGGAIRDRGALRTIKQRKPKAS